MSITTGNYFYSPALRQRFIDALENASQENRLQTDEWVWLRSLVRPAVVGTTDPVRVDQLTVDRIWIKPLELGAALLLTHDQTDDPRAYLYTLADGIEVFSDRHSLLAALRERFAKGYPDALFECEKVEDDPFRAQMLAIVDHQAEHIGQLTGQLKLTPSLLDVATAALARQLREKVGHLSLEPATHLLQIVPCPDGDNDAMPVTQTLAHAAFDDARKVQLAAGIRRRFLDQRGVVASAADSALLSQAFAWAAAGVPEHYSKLLEVFWKGSEGDQRNRRDLAIESLEGSLRGELYECRHNGSLTEKSLNLLLPLVRRDRGPALTSQALRGERLLIRIGESARCTLAGTFVVQSGNYTDRSVLWFSSAHKLIRFADMAALTAFFATAQGREQLRPLLALQDQAILLEEGPLQVDLKEIRTSLVADRIDSILALQTRNLIYALGLPCDPERMTTMIDDALDIRQLLDPRQLHFHAGRWRPDGPFDFDVIWLKHSGMSSSSAALTDSSTVSPDQASTGTNRVLATPWVKQSRAFDLGAERLRQLDNSLLVYAEQTLMQYVCVLVRSVVKIRNIRVRWLESNPANEGDVETLAVPVNDSQFAITMDLVSLLLERVTGHRSGPLAVDAQVLFEAAPTASVRVDLINHVLERAAVNFMEGYVGYFVHSRGEFLRLGGRQFQPDTKALGLREEAMRLYLGLAKREEWLDDRAFNMVRQVLDRPVRSLRTALGVAVTEAFTVSLIYANQPPALLCDTLVLSQPASQGSPVLLWTHTKGWRQFSSLQQLQAWLQRKLHGAKREHWLACVGEGDRTSLRMHLLNTSDNELRIRLDRVDGHFAAALQQGVLRHKQKDLQQLCLRAVRCHLEAGLFTRLAAATEPDSLLASMLDELSITVENAVFEALLPDWLISASVADLSLYLTTLRRYYVVSNHGRDFLFDIPPLQDYARAQLVAQLSKDFPDQALNPDEITVTSRHYVTAFPSIGELPSAVAAATLVNTESLTDYAINRFFADQGTNLSVQSVTQPQASDLLTPAYLRQLVRRVDVGAGYTALLRKTFAADDPHYLARRRVFMDQLPSTLLALALPEKFKGTLSAKAFEFISRVVDMPDGIARSPVDGTRVIISPLQLIADRGMSPDPVAGLYLICPAVADTGPVILYAMYHPPFIFREYSNPQALLDDIRRDASLQQLLLGRLDPATRKRYDHGGFVEPHLPYSVEGFADVPFRAPGPISLGIAEFKGNALQMLFTGALKVRLDTGVASAVTNDQADQAGRAFLATLGFEQALSLLPGKLASLVTLWQSHSLFRASAASASGRRWGEALSEFSAALGAVISAREQTVEEQALTDSLNTGASDTPGEEDKSPAGFSWRHAGLNTEQRIRLQSLEAKDAVLADMRHDGLLNLYIDKNDTAYAVVAGKVYEVRTVPYEDKLTVVGADGTVGPRLILDGQQHWQLDLGLHLRGGGGIITRLNAASAEVSAEDVLIIEAKGMPEIRSLYRDRARRIGQAHFQARRYLQTSLDNLSGYQQGRTLAPQVKQMIGDFFGVDSPDTGLCTEIETSIKTLFDALMEDSLSPFSSPRFVVGSNRPGRETIVGFVIKADPKRRVFLTDRFFNVPFFRLKPEAALEGFDAPVHYQAANLIHEISHQALDTFDIAYLEAMAPYPDLLDDSVQNGGVLEYVSNLHNFQLSHRSARNSLFTLYRDGQWRDITAQDDRGFKVILRHTQTTNLSEARDVFLADAKKRTRVMLCNADSLTLLILNLGRRAYAVSSLGSNPTPTPVTALATGSDG